jgi:hypothetical protein
MPDTAWATVYEVAQRGVDAGAAGPPDGSLNSPFPTISACAAVAGPGDTCRVHAGTYRETISPKTNGTTTAPVRFVVADGECATVSGTEPLGVAFTNAGGNVWTAPVPAPIDQMFSGGAMIWEAQWPNRTPGALFDVPKARTGQGTGVFATADGGTTSILVDPNLPAGDWTGATVFILPGDRWQSDSRPVLAYDVASHTLTLDTTVPWAEKATQPIPANEYYLFGSTLALDVQDEWVVSAAAAGATQPYVLSYFSADDPANHGLEYKSRAYAFDVAATNVEIVGFHVFGAAVRVTGNGNVVDSIAIEYPTHLRSFDAYYTDGEVNRIVGDDNVWKNTIIEKSGSAGLIVAGNGNTIENNIANDVAYQATNHAGFDMDDWQKSYVGNVFAYNTVARSGRSGIFQYGARGGRVLMNRVSNWALLTNDMGGIYAWGTDGQGTEIAYNDVGGSSAFWSNGIYLDDRTKHFIAHHNYVHDSTFYGFCIKEENLYVSNTIANVGTPFLVSEDNQNNVWENTNRAQVRNDLADGTMLLRVGILPTVVTDYGYFEAPVHVTGYWQHVVIPIASMAQPKWFVQKPFDLTSVQQIAFTPWTNGDFEVDLDNIQLQGSSSLTVDDFESPGAANGLGGYAWGGSSGDGGTASSFATLTYPAGGPPGSTRYAAFAGTIVLGDNTWAVVTEGAGGTNLSGYTQLSFDVRGAMRGLRVLATGGSPVQDHDDSCSLSGTQVPACAIGAGAIVPGIAQGADGGPPDLGAFTSGEPPWPAGAQRPNDPTLCGKLPDIDAALPPPVPNPWADAGNADAALDGASAADATLGAADSGADGGTSAGALGGSPGCGCHVGSAPATSGVSVIGMVAAMLARRRRRAARR